MSTIKDHDKELLLRCLSDQADPYQQQLAWDWIHKSVAHKAYYESLRDAWISNSVNKKLDDEKIESSLSRVKNRISQQSPKNNKKTSDLSVKRTRSIHGTFYISMPWARLAAAIAIAFILGGGGMYFSTEFYKKAFIDHEYFVVEAPRGARSRITLTDGSEVWLNAGSRIRYPKTFNRENRDIYLEGEGYFKVAKNENLAFKVHASDIIVEALGTEFNVKAYPEEGRIETTLVEGSVNIFRGGSSRRENGIILQPNQKANFFADGHLIESSTTSPESVTQNQVTNQASSGSLVRQSARVIIEKNVNTEVSTSWKDKRWVFERESLGELAVKLERQYDVEIAFDNEEIKTFHLSGTLEEESIEQVLEALQLTLPINFSINHKNVYLTINQRKYGGYKQLLRNQ